MATSSPAGWASRKPGGHPPRGPSAMSVMTPFSTVTNCMNSRLPVSCGPALGILDHHSRPGSCSPPKRVRSPMSIGWPQRTAALPWCLPSVSKAFLQRRVPACTGKAATSNNHRTGFHFALHLNSMAPSEMHTRANTMTLTQRACHLPPSRPSSITARAASMIWLRGSLAASCCSQAGAPSRENQTPDKTSWVS